MILFGNGPSTFREYSGFNSGSSFSQWQVSYGIVGWSQTCISIGVPGVIFFTLAYILALRDAVKTLRNRNVSSSTKALAFAGCSGCLVVLYEYFLYGSSMVSLGVISFFALLATGIAAKEATRTGTRQYVNLLHVQARPAEICP
jgi:hypothetical protein